MFEPSTQKVRFPIALEVIFFHGQKCLFVMVATSLTATSLPSGFSFVLSTLEIKFCRCQLCSANHTLIPLYLTNSVGGICGFVIVDWFQDN